MLFNSITNALAMFQVMQNTPLRIVKIQIYSTLMVIYVKYICISSSRYTCSIACLAAFIIELQTGFIWAGFVVNCRLSNRF